MVTQPQYKVPQAFFGPVNLIDFKKIEVILSIYGLEIDRNRSSKTIMAGSHPFLEKIELPMLADTYDVPVACSIESNSTGKSKFHDQSWCREGSLVLKLRDLKDSSGMFCELEWNLDYQDENKATNLKERLVRSFLFGHLRKDSQPEKVSSPPQEAISVA